MNPRFWTQSQREKRTYLLEDNKYKSEYMGTIHLEVKFTEGTGGHDMVGRQERDETETVGVWLLREKKDKPGIVDYDVV